MTSEKAISEIAQSSKVIFLQEHWLFNYQLHRLDTISDGLQGCGKSVDDDDPIQPIQKPRGYGGVGILWADSIDHLVTPISDGSNRIQCIILKGDIVNILLVSVYMPCRGQNDNFLEFCECIDQLGEIASKYIDHDIVIGGDFNEDMNSTQKSRRMLYLDNFVREFKMKFVSTPKTFIHSNGRDCSTIDYFLVRETPLLHIADISRLDVLGGNTSDHHPVRCEVEAVIRLTPDAQQDSVNTDTSSHRVKWSKVNTDLYSSLVDDKLQKVSLDLSNNYSIESSIMSIHTVLQEAADASGGISTQSKQRRLRSVTPVIKKAMATNKEAHFIYKKKAADGTLNHSDVERRKRTKKHLRSLIRREDASHQTRMRANIMAARREDSKLFHKLVRNQRGKSRAVIPQLEVHGEVHRGDNAIRNAWKTHFEALATPTNSDKLDSVYQNIVDYDVDVIKDLFENGRESISDTTIDEVTEAVKSLNKGKAPDIYSITAEHIIYGGNQLIVTLCEVFNAIIHLQCVPDILKAGTITPVFKKKGSKLEAKNYRGITVLPVVAKLLELILRERLRYCIDQQQNPMQRGFTCGSSPLFCALIIEEFIRETTGKKGTSLTAYLDAKTAFDVVYHNSLLRKLYHMGIGGGLWNILNSFYENAGSVVKWMGAASAEFSVQQGVRQGGILSADLYKVYINQLLDRLYLSGFGAMLGDIICNAPTCADDLSTLSDSSKELQMLCSIANDYSNMERYELQPTKSVVLPYIPKKSKHRDDPVILLGDQQMPVVNKTTHVGVVRTSDNSPTTAIDENLQKARRTLYSLMSAGLHGEKRIGPGGRVYTYFEHMSYQF